MWLGRDVVTDLDIRVAKVLDPRRPPEQRLSQVETLVRAGEFETAERLLLEFQSYPDLSPQVRRLQAVVRQLKRWGISSKVEAYCDPLVRLDGEATDFDAADAVRIARRPGAKKVVFVFTGRARQIWLSVHLLHQILPDDCTVVYLQDVRNCGYVFGLEAFGDGYTRTLEGMRRLIASLDSPEVFVIGSSSGGWGALRYALDLNATRVLGISPGTDFTLMEEYRAETAARIGLSESEATAAFPPGSFDLLTLYGDAARPPELILAFGGGHEEDREASRRMGALPKVTLHEVPGYERHDVMAELIAKGEIRGLIDALMRPAEGG